MAAATPGEIRVILEEAGLDSGEDAVDEIWRKHKPTEAELEPLDDDELEIASGGDRDYGENGCESTTDSKWCWASDACNMLIISYTNLWMMNLGTCPMCGGKNGIGTKSANTVTRAATVKLRRSMSINATAAGTVRSDGSASQEVCRRNFTGDGRIMRDACHSFTHM